MAFVVSLLKLPCLILVGGHTLKRMLTTGNGSGENNNRLRDQNARHKEMKNWLCLVKRLLGTKELIKGCHKEVKNSCFLIFLLVASLILPAQF